MRGPSAPRACRTPRGCCSTTATSWSTSSWRRRGTTTTSTACGPTPPAWSGRNRRPRYPDSAGESGGIAQSDDIAPKAAESPPKLEDGCPSLGGGIVRIRRCSGIVILAAGLGLVAGAPGARAAGPDTAPPLVTNLKPVTDAVVAAVNTATSAVVAHRRADI